LHPALGPRVAITQPEIRPRPQGPRHGRLNGPRRRGRGQRSHGELLQPAPDERPRPPALDHPRRTPHRDRHLDRTDLPPPPTTGRPRTVDPHRVRDHHDHASHPGCVTQPVTYLCSRPITAAEWVWTWVSTPMTTSTTS